MWLYNEKVFTEEDIEDYCSFVYIITNLLNNKKYIGKKTFYFTKTSTVKGKKVRKKILSDYDSYYGSNKPLQNDVKEHGIKNFKREILYLCKTKSEASYLELREQIDHRALENPEYYNDYIIVRINRNHLKNLTSETK